MAQSINVLHYCLCVAPFLSVIYSPQPAILCFLNLILYGFYRYKQELFVITVPTVVASKDCRLLGFVLCSWSNSLLLLISCGHVWFAVALTKARYSAVSPLITKKHRSLQSPAEGKKKKKHQRSQWVITFFFFLKKGLQRIWESLYKEVYSSNMNELERLCPAGISIISLRTWYQVEDEACTSFFYLAWDWWLDWGARQRRRKSSPPHQEEKQCSTRLHIHYSK